MTDLIIDGNSLFARSYFAAAKAGRDPVQFALRSAVSLLKQTHVLGRVDRALICWDGDQPKTEKKRLAEKPADYVPKLQEFADQLVAMTNIQQARLIEHEADMEVLPQLQMEGQFTGECRWCEFRKGVCEVGRLWFTRVPMMP